MLFIMVVMPLNFFYTASSPCAPPSMSQFMPGSMPMICDIGPIFEICSNWVDISRNVNFPLPMRSIISCCYSTSITSLMVRISPLISPMPRSFETKDSESKGSKSLKCSPVPGEGDENDR